MNFPQVNDIVKVIDSRGNITSGTVTNAGKGNGVLTVTSGSNTHTDIKHRDNVGVGEPYWRLATEAAGKNEK